MTTLPQPASPEREALLRAAPCEAIRAIASRIQAAIADGEQLQDLSFCETVYVKLNVRRNHKKVEFCEITVSLDGEEFFSIGACTTAWPVATFIYGILRGQT